MDARWNSTGSVATNQMKETDYRRGEEYYIGDGQANVTTTSANQVARLITDKDLLDTIFAVVEPDKYGRVPTSKLISLVRETYHGDHDELEMALDPMGLDMAIDLETFKSVVFNWEDKQATHDLFIPQTTSTPNNSPKSSCKLNSSFDFDELNFLHISSSADDDKMDRYTLENEISQLKYNNSKLKSENTELENQLTNLDVLFGNLQHDCENLRHKNQNLENQLQTIQKELDLCVSKFAEESNKWDKEKAALINERKDFERQVKNLKDELNEMIKDLTNLRNSEEVLKNSFLEHEFSFVQAVNEKEVLEERVTQLRNYCDEFRERLVETLRNNEHVRKMRHELEEEVCLLRTKLYQKEFETNNSEENDDLDVTLDSASNLNSVLMKFEKTSNLFDELMEDTYHESPFKRPLCGKSPDRIPCLSSESDWSLLDDLKVLIDRASNQLNAICATEMLDSYTTNQNNFSNTGYMIQNGSEKEHKERNVNKIGYDVNSLDLGNSDGVPSPGSLSPETLRLHINAQLKLLRIHIARSQNILISLQSNSMPLLVKSSQNSPIDPYSSTDFSSSQAHHPVQTSLNRPESHNSTPSHNRTRSCPILPSETAFITKGTQTEPLNSTLTKDANTRLHEAFNHKTFATPGISITPDFTDYDLNSTIPMPRNRSSSYSEAIKHGNEESDDPRLNRHLSVLQEEEHENSDHSPSPLICRSNQVVAITLPSPRLPPPYRPPPTPSLSRCLYHSLGNVSRVPIMNIQCSTPSVEILPSDQRFTQAIRLSLPPQRQRRVTLVRQLSDPFPAEINSNEFSPSQMSCINHSMSAQKMDYRDSQHQLSYLSSDVSTPVVMRNINFLDSEISPIVVCDVTPEQRIAQTSQPSTITVSDSGVDTATEKVSDAEESDEEIDVTIGNLKIRQRKLTSGSTGNINPAIQRSRAIDFDFGYDDFDVTECKDDSDVDVKKDILEGMTQVTNRRTFSPPPLGGTPEFIISTSPKSSVEIHQPSFRRKVGEIQKNRLLMPELMENSETESAKNSGGSMESETEQIAPTCSDVFNPPAPCGDGPFPSLPDNFLKLLQLHKSNDKIERLSEKDVEIKFHSLLLAFRTDKFTLTNRLDLHQRQRDIAEKNIEEEVIALKENLNALSQLCNDQETREIVKRLHHHLDVLHQSTARMSSRAEVYGAVQQEDRTNRAIEVMLLYVDNLKRVQEKCTAEYEEMRRIMVENNLLSEDGSESEETRRNLRSHSMTNSSVGKQASKRRASIAALPRSASERLDGNTKFINFVNTSRSTVCSIGSRRCSLYYNLRSSFSSDQEKLVKKHAADDLLIPSSSVEHSEDEHLYRPKRLSTTRRSSKRDSVISKNLDIVKSSSPETENSKLSDSVFASGDKAVSDVVDASNSTMDCNAGNGLESLSYGPPNWQVTGDHSEPSSENDDDLDDFDDDDDETEVSRPSNSNRFRPSNMVDTAVNLLNLSQLANNEHLLHGVRYTVGGILFVAAIFSLLIAFFPGSQATNSCRQASSWYYSIDELFRPHLELRRRLRPPM